MPKALNIAGSKPPTDAEDGAAVRELVERRDLRRRRSWIGGSESSAATWCAGDARLTAAIAAGHARCTATRSRPGAGGLRAARSSRSRAALGPGPATVDRPLHASASAGPRWRGPSRSGVPIQRAGRSGRSEAHEVRQARSGAVDARIERAARGRRAAERAPEQHHVAGCDQRVSARALATKLLADRFEAVRGDRAGGGELRRRPGCRPSRATPAPRASRRAPRKPSSSRRRPSPTGSRRRSSASTQRQRLRPERGRAAPSKAEVAAARGGVRLHEQVPGWGRPGRSRAQHLFAPGLDERAHHARRRRRLRLRAARGR